MINSKHTFNYGIEEESYLLETDTKLGKSMNIYPIIITSTILTCFKNYIFETIGWHWQLSSKITT